VSRRTPIAALAAVLVAGLAGGATSANAASFQSPVTVPMKIPSWPNLVLGSGGSAFLGSLDGHQLLVHPRGGSFGSPVDLLPTEARAFDNQIGVSASGEVVTVYTRLGAPGRRVYRRVRAVFRSPDGTLSSPRTISTLGHTAASPQVAVNDRGDAVAAWLRYTGAGNWQVQVAVRKAGGPFGTAHTISGDDGIVRGTPVAVAIGGNGDGVVAWRPGAPRKSRPVRIAGVTAAGDAGSVQTLDTATTSDAYGVNGAPVRVAMGANGAAAAIWISQGRAQFGGDVKVATRAPGARSFGDPERLVDAGGPVLGWDIGVDGAGNVTALWANYDRIGADVDRSIRSGAFVATGSAGGRFGTPVRVSETDRSVTGEGGALGRTLDLAVADSGDAIAAWASATSYGGDARVEVVARKAGAAFGDPTVLSPETTRAFGPVVAIDGLGDLAVSWDALPGPKDAGPAGVPVVFGSVS
jgi:hypothetical protein